MKRLDHKIARFLISIVSIGLILSFSYLIYAKYSSKIKYSLNPVLTAQTSDENEVISTEAPDKTVSEQIIKDPPKHQKVQKSVTATSGDKKVTTLTEGGISSSEINTIGQNGSGGANPYSIKFIDETGRYTFVEQPLKKYFNDNLHWSSEISALYQITIRDAGDTGWSGQWAGAYTMSGSDIISAYGAIFLNSSYYKDSSPEMFTNYMELILSHEYGHHYTQYYKWVSLDLPVGARFPDAYYLVRPLSRDNTSVECSDWRNCESEIIAEDYSYLYSGFGLHQMSSTYGYPSSATREWLTSLASVYNSGASPAVSENDNPPTISLNNIADPNELKGSVAIVANASDDNGILKVRFYIDNILVAEKAISPYQFNLDTTLYLNGQHTIKAVAYDSSKKTGETSANVRIKNSPKITITSPSQNPFTWTSELEILRIQIRTSSNVPVVKLKIYINDQFQTEINAANADVSWHYSNGPAGQYILKVEAYDAEGNRVETTLNIDKL